MKSIPFTKRYKSKNEAEFVVDALNQESLEKNGKYTQKCCEFLKKFLPTDNVVVTSNGFTALYMALLLINVNPSDEVLISAYSCPAAMNSVLLCGAKPVLCGINDKGVVTASTLEAGYTERTKAVIINHYGGFSCDLDEIVDFCKKNNLILIEDCATAFGTKYKSKHVGTFGQMAVFSFNDKKDLCVGEAGTLVVNSALWSNSHLINNGIVRIENENEKTIPCWVGKGFSNKVSDVVSSVLYAQLTDCEYIVREKQHIRKEYTKWLSPYQEKCGFKIGMVEYCEPNGNTFYLLFDDKNVKFGVMEHLKNNNVVSLSHYGSLAFCAEKDGNIVLSSGDNGASFDSKMLRLPVFIGLTKEDIAYISQLIIEFLER